MPRAECSYLLLYCWGREFQVSSKVRKIRSFRISDGAVDSKAGHRLLETAQAGRELGTVKRARQH